MLPRLRCVARGGLLLIAGAMAVDAGIRPSFGLDDCAWNATHIVQVQTTAKNGFFSVVESLKGELKPGDLLEVPELKAGTHALPISAYPKGEEFSAQKNWDIEEQIPGQPIGARLILFLKRAGDGGASSGAGMAWQPASAWGEMKASALWIDSERAFCFQQWENPGPSALSPCMRWPVTSSDVDVFTARIKVVLQTKRELAGALALKDSDGKAEKLKRIALGDVPEAQKEAVDALAKVGPSALPAILQVMDQAPACCDGRRMVQVLAESAGSDRGKVLLARLQQDVIYWKTVGPTLTQDWLGHLIQPGSSLFVKFDETSMLIQELDQERYAPAAETVVELHDFWISQPQLYDPKWGERDLRNGGSVLEMIQAESFALARRCDDFVRHVGRQKEPNQHP
jgi:hypothetical protein